MSGVHGSSVLIVNAERMLSKFFSLAQWASDKLRHNAGYITNLGQRKILPPTGSWNSLP